MIGKIGVGKSAYHVLLYCLSDKRNLSEEDKIGLSKTDGLQHKDRAEILYHNACFEGSIKELNAQFRDVEALSDRVEKPVMSISLRLADTDQLSTQQWIDIAAECAREFDFADHQYLAVLHKDSIPPHLHIIANRVGLDGKAVTDSKSYQRIAAFSRKMELKYKLTEVLSPKAFLSKEDRLIPRHDKRKEKLKRDIAGTLKKVIDYNGFEKEMNALGYSIEKSRGIAFTDQQKVRIKGSEVGYSLATLEKILAVNIDRALNKFSFSNEKRDEIMRTILPGAHRQGHIITEGFLAKLAGNLFNYVETNSPVPYEFRPGKKPKKKKYRRSI